MKQRIAWADTAKAIGIFLVVLGHLSIINGRDLGLCIFSFHMPLFFILSGYFTPQPGTIKSGEYIKNSVKQLIVPYLFFMLLTWPLFAPIIWLNRQGFDISSIWELLWKTIVGILIPFNNDPYPWSIFYNGAMWFLLGLFWVRVLYALTMKWDKKFVFVLSLVCLVVTRFLKQRGYDAMPWYLHTVFFAYPFFMIGAWLRNNKVMVKMSDLQWWQNLLVSVVSMAVCIVVAEYNGNMSIGSITYGHSVLLCLMTGVLGSLAVINFSMLIPQSRVISRVGGGSIVILGLQGPLIIICSLLLKRIGVINQSMTWYQGLVFSLMVVVICYPVIVILSNYFPQLMGRKKKN